VEKEGITDVDDVERVYRETFILTTLKHENIIRLHEVSLASCLLPPASCLLPLVESSHAG
jgi:hypothetical protein